MKIIKIAIACGIAALGLGSCNLNEAPISNVSKGDEENAGERIVFKTRDEVLAQYNGMYSALNGSQEFWYNDWLVMMETHADNSYAGSSGAELVTLEAQTQDAVNKNLERDWNKYLEFVALANKIICNIDAVPDPKLTDAERKQWKAESLILRAWMYYDMVRLWGDVPLVLEEAPTLTNENFDEVYPLLFPSRTPKAEVYEQIIIDLKESLQYAPNLNTSNKQLLTKTVANALLAKVYAEEDVRDYAKTIAYCAAVEADGLELMPNYADLFSVNDVKTDVNYRNTKESIFELTYAGGGNWSTWMFGIDVTDPSSTYNWAKWITPSRDLIAAFTSEGDEIRMNQAIVWAQPSWSIHYPSSNYPFMYKTRSKFNSIIKLRLADILLLKAEAYVATGNLSEAAKLVNKVRDRVELSPLSSTTTASATLMKAAVLKERRLELAFEGHRWFDLVRNGVVKEVMNTLNSRDPGRAAMLPVTDETILLPIGETVMNLNQNLTQNPGY